MTQKYIKQRSLLESSEMTSQVSRLRAHVHNDKKLLDCVLMRDRPQWQKYYLTGHICLILCNESML